MGLIDANLLKAEFTGNFSETYSPAQIKALIDTAPEIDPVHAAGGCYCWECVNLGSSIFDNDLFYCGYWGYSVYKDDFCSRGKKQKETEEK